MKKIYGLFTLFALLFIPVNINAQDTIYTNNFNDGIGDATIVGNGAVEWDTTKGFGYVYHNATMGEAIRTNYLLLDTNIFAGIQNAGKYQMSISFWVNLGTATGYYWCPMFSAYGAPPDSVNGNTWPMIVLETRLWMQHNWYDWCNYTDAQNVNGVNYISTTWIDDGNWHLYTMTLDTSTAKIYTDDTLRNEWTFADTVGNASKGFFEHASDLKYICLGGNQAWNWGDVDPAFKYDDVTIYSGILDSTQIAAIMAAKKSGLDTVINATACVSYTSPSGKVWNESGSYTDTIPKVGGGDSIIVVNLSIQNTTSDITTQACGSYTSPSGKVWTASGTYNDTIPNAAGCDSIITINLTVNKMQIAGDLDCSGTIDVSKGEIAGDVNGDGKIDNGEIAGDINGDGKIDNGEIAGDVNGDGKIDNGEITGDINGDGKIDNGEVKGDANGNGVLDGNEVSSVSVVLSSNIKFYPNPVTDKLNITSDNILIENVQIRTITGVSVFNKDFNASQVNIDFSGLSSGMYIVTVNTNLGQVNKNIIK